MWKNKHVIVALLVAPMLAIMGWFAVDYLVAERAQPAQPGAMYPLLAKSNCRYESGQCDLDNEEFEMSLSSRQGGGSDVELVLTSRFALDGARVQVGTSQDAAELAAADDAGLVWTMPLGVLPAKDAPIRIAAVRDQSTFYAEVTAIFLHDRPGAP